MEDWVARDLGGMGQVSVTQLVYSDNETFILITSESSNPEGSFGPARKVVDETVKFLGTFQGFRLLEPVSEFTLSGHEAAEASYQYANGNITNYNSFLAVVGPEWFVTWTLLGIWHNQADLGLRSSINQTERSFEVLPAPVVNVFVANHSRLLVAGLIAVAVEGVAFCVHTARWNRRRGWS